MKISQLQFVVVVFVVISVQIFGQPPTFVTSGQDSLQVAEGNSLNLECPILNDAFELEFEWLRNGHPMGTRRSIESKTLKIDAVTRADAGAYRCSATFREGAVLTRIINVTVSYLDSFASFSPSSFRISTILGGYFLIIPPDLSAFPTDNISWKWFHYDSEVFSNRTHFVSNSGELVVLSATRGSLGLYRVEATSIDVTLGKAVSDNFLVHLNSDFADILTSSEPAIVLKPKDTIFIKRSDDNRPLVLECVAYSSNLNSFPSIIWLHNSTTITADGFRHKIEHFSRRLIVQNPTFPQNSGVYECRIPRIASSQAWVQVFEQPTILNKSPPEVFGSVGLPLKLPCLTAGWPTPTVTWFKNAKEVVDSNGKVLDAGSVLMFDQLTDNDEGVYQCQVSNVAGSMMATTWLRTKSSGPKLSRLPTNKSVVVGQSVEFVCSADGAPPPEIRWKVDGIDLIIDGLQYVLRQEDGLNTLVIPTAQVDDSGRYSCIAKNSQGTTQAVAFLQVAGRTQIETGPTNQSAIIGSNVVFSCTVSQETGRSRYSRNWYFNNQLLVAGGSRKVSLLPNGDLFIRQVGPTNIGVYKCTVTSPAGTETRTGHLRIMEKPGMALRVVATLQRHPSTSFPSEVLLTWTVGFDGHSPLVAYTVQSRVVGPDTDLWSDWELVLDNVPGDRTSVTIDNLKPSATFQFRLVALNRFGPGVPSLPSNNVTMPQQPPAASPRNVAGSARSATSIMVQWQPPPPEQWNGELVGYVVRYRLADYPGIPWLESNVSSTRARNLPLEGLITWRQYQLQVAAFNDRGTGVFSKPVLVTTLEGVPTDYPKLLHVSAINSTTVKVDFQPPSHQMIPGVNQGYKVQFWRGTAGGGVPFKEMVLLPDPSRVSVLVNGLEKFGSYNVTVLCFTAPGDGPRSRTIPVTTLEDVPGPVSSLHFQDLRFSSLEVVWNVPSNPNGILLDYQLRFWPTSRMNDVKSHTLDPDTTRTFVQGLSASTEYSFQVSASTKIGRGPVQTAIVATGIPPELPGMPTSVVVSDIRARSCILQFTPGFDGNTQISRWIVEGKVGKSTMWTLVYNISAPKRRSILVENLRPYTKYELRLIAENIKGRGLPSSPSKKFGTLQSEPEIPAEIGVEPDSDTSVLVSWTPLHSFAWNGDPKGYLLIYRKNNTINSQWKEILIGDVKSDEYKVTDLDPFSYYLVKMLTENTFGRSRSTREVHTRTYEGVPSLAPSNVHVTPLDGRKLRVSWDPVPAEGRNGLIVGYRLVFSARDSLPALRWRADADGLYEGQTEVVGQEQRQTILTRLRAFTRYKVNVVGFTIMGPGRTAGASVQVLTGQDVPASPSGVLSNYVSETQIRIKWQPPYRPNGPITRYEIAYRKNTTNRQSADRAQLPSDVLLFSATQLIPNTMYIFSVTAATIVGWGQSSEIRVFTTNLKVPPYTPSAPSQSGRKPQGSRHIWLQWNGADNPMKAPIRLIEVEHQRVNTGQWVRWPETFSAVVTEQQIARLAPNTAYRARIRLTNDFGQSRWSGHSRWIKTLDQAPSSPPLSLSAFPYDSSSLRVVWHPPPSTSWNSDHIGYRIIYRSYDTLSPRPSNSSFNTVEVPMTADRPVQFEHIIRGLARFRHYLVHVQTFNRRGSSRSSSPLFVYVGYSIPKHSLSNLKAIALSSTSISLVWDRWPVKNEPISGFRLRYRPKLAAVDQPWMEEVIVGDKTTTTTVVDILKFVQYQFELSAYNKAGQGPKSQLLVTTLSDRPGPPGKLLFSDILLDSVNVSWSPPVSSNGLIIGYIVNYRTFKLKEEFRKEIQEKTRLNYLLAEGLEENVTYYFAIKAETSIGYGPESKGQVTIGPTVGSPAHPGKPKIFPGHTTVTLEWTNGNAGKSSISGHIIQAMRTVEKRTKVRKRNLVVGPEHPLGKWLIFSHLTGPTTVYEVAYRELEPASFYRFRVYSRNDNGISYPSPASDVVQVPEYSATFVPFYTEWWFLIIVILVSLLVVVLVVAVMCLTGTDHPGDKFGHGKRNSVDSLQLADGGIVSYELRASKRTGNNHGNRQSQQHQGRPFHQSLSQLHTNTSWLSVPLPNEHTEPLRKTAFNLPPYVHLASSMYGDPTNTIDEIGQCGLVENDDTDAEEDEAIDEDREAASIVQHYETSDVAYRDTWRRAKQTAVEANDDQNGHAQTLASSFRPPSITSSNLSDVNQQFGRQPMTGFSSFV